MPALAYLNSYTSKYSVDGDPWKNYMIGKEHGLVGCGKNLKRMGVPWFTKVDGHLIWHGCILRPSSTNPWSTPTLHTFEVECHYDLGILDDIFKDIGIDKNILPKWHSISLNDPCTELLIMYAKAKYNESLKGTATASTKPSVSLKLEETSSSSSSSSSNSSSSTDNEDPITNSSSTTIVHCPSEKDIKILRLEEENAYLHEKVRKLIAALHVATE